MKGFWKHKYLRPIACLGAGAALLTAGVFANYENASGYSVCKTALKDLLFETNFTAEYRMEVNLDGETMAGTEGLFETNGGGNPSRHTVEKELGDQGVYSYEAYNQDDMRISHFTYQDGTEASHAYKSRVSGDSDRDQEDGSLVGTRNELVEKAVNFVELACDTLVGDLKNSIILRDEKDGVRTYDVNLTGDQMPDLVSAGTSLMMSAIREDMERSHQDRLANPQYYQDENGNPTGAEDELIYQSLFAGGDPAIESVQGTMTVDEKNNPTLMDGSLRMIGWDASGQSHTMELTGRITLRDFGSTEITPVDLYSLPNLEINGWEESAEDESVTSTTTFVLNTNDTQEEQRVVIEKAEEYAGNGQQVEIVDQHGRHLQTITGGANVAISE